MKLVISPAKSLDFSTPVPIQKFTKPAFLKESKNIHKVLAKLSPKELSDLMAISDKLADLNWERNQSRSYNLNEISDSVRQAIFAFNGDVYTGLDAFSFQENQYNAVNDKVRILSGLYGILKPFDLIEPYRLEMGKKLKVDDADDLYKIWKPLIADFLNNEMNADEVLVNLASTEYFSAVDVKKVNAKIITPEFKDYKNDKLKIISFFAKKARGQMARFIIDENIEKANDLKAFNIEGYEFNEALSTDNKFVFIR